MLDRPLKVAVLASGRGSNLAALIAARDAGQMPIELVLVGTDKTDCGALAHARAAGVASLALNPRDYPSRRDFDLALFQAVAASGAELLVLAGYMRIIHADALRPWIGRMINIHPSLLPKYRGLHTHRQALVAGDAEHGASVHYVTAELDGGPVIAQALLDVRADDTEQTLAARLLPLEHRLLPAVVAQIVAGRVRLDGDAVIWDKQPLTTPLRLIDQELAR
ncbi:MAG: phosphoribosylglycinamide formyltransferase [Dyella sp.]